MKWENFAPKLPFLAYAAVAAAAFLVVMREGVTEAQKIDVSAGITVKPLNALAMAGVMAVIGISVFVIRRLREK